MPFGACETGLWRTTSSGGRVIAGAACDIASILAHYWSRPRRTWPPSAAFPATALQSTEMQPSTSPANKPRWYLIPPRILLVTFLLTLLSFAVSLSLGIPAVVIAARLRGLH